MGKTLLHTLAGLLAPHELRLRGGFPVSAADQALLAPHQSGDAETETTETSAVPASQTLLLIGSAGGAFWPAFADTQGVHEGVYARPDPLDHWTRTVIDPIAAQMNARAVYPFEGPPYYPFQQWALRAGRVFPSPPGLLVHPRYGLWHAYRAALIVRASIEIPAPDKTAVSPCEGCAGRPCLTACPVGAFSANGLDVTACRSHLRGGNGDACFAAACLARRACPVGAAYRYGAPQSRFHMNAFAKKP